MTTTGPSPGRPAGSAVVIRELRWTDFPDFVGAYYRLYDERDRGDPIGIHLFHEKPSHEDEAAWFGRLYSRVLRGECVVAVAERDGHAVGHCTVGRNGESERSEIGHTATLGIMVHELHRGTGVGTALLEAVIGQSRGKFDAIHLGVFATNAGARRLYERFGFVPYGRLPAAILRGSEYIDMDLMVLDLRSPPPNR